jgi:hypothetical protein
MAQRLTKYYGSIFRAKCDKHNFYIAWQPIVDDFRTLFGKINFLNSAPKSRNPR